MKQTDDPWQAVRNVIVRSVDGAVAVIGVIAIITIIWMVAGR